MRKVTQEIINAFNAGYSKTVSNTHTDGKAIYLHGNKIAEKRNGEIWITNAGWQSNTTKERLNRLGANIHQKDWKWYLNGKPWNGEWIKLH